MMRFEIRSHVPEVFVVAGAALGERHLEEVVRALPSGGGGQTVILDFEGVEHATASYLKAFVLGLIRAGQSTSEAGDVPSLDVFVTVARVSKDIREELAEVAVSQRTPVLEALKWNEERISKARLHGRIDDVLAETLELLTSRGPATATELVQSTAASKIGLTGWNNRLADLHRLRLVRRMKLGRHWMYEPVSMEVARG